MSSSQKQADRSSEVESCCTLIHAASSVTALLQAKQLQLNKEERLKMQFKS